MISQIGCVAATGEPPRAGRGPTSQSIGDQGGTHGVPRIRAMSRATAPSAIGRRTTQPSRAK